MVRINPNLQFNTQTNEIDKNDSTSEKRGIRVYDTFEKMIKKPLGLSMEVVDGNESSRVSIKSVKNYLMRNGCEVQGLKPKQIKSICKFIAAASGSSQKEISGSYAVDLDKTLGVFKRGGDVLKELSTFVQNDINDDASLKSLVGKLVNPSVPDNEVSKELASFFESDNQDKPLLDEIEPYSDSSYDSGIENIFTRNYQVKPKAQLDQNKQMLLDTLTNHLENKLSVSDQKRIEKQFQSKPFTENVVNCFQEKLDDTSGNQKRVGLLLQILCGESKVSSLLNVAHDIFAIPRGDDLPQDSLILTLIETAHQTDIDDDRFEMLLETAKKPFYNTKNISLLADLAAKQNVSDEMFAESVKYVPNTSIETFESLVSLIDETTNQNMESIAKLFKAYNGLIEDGYLNWDMFDEILTQVINYIKESKKDGSISSIEPFQMDVLIELAGYSQRTGVVKPLVDFVFNCIDSEEDWQTYKPLANLLSKNFIHSVIGEGVSENLLKIMKDKYETLSDPSFLKDGKHLINRILKTHERAVHQGIKIIYTLFDEIDKSLSDHEDGEMIEYVAGMVGMEHMLLKNLFDGMNKEKQLDRNSFVDLQDIKTIYSKIDTNDEELKSKADELIQAYLVDEGGARLVRGLLTIWDDVMKLEQKDLVSLLYDNRISNIKDDEKWNLLTDFVKAHSSGLVQEFYDRTGYTRPTDKKRSQTWFDRQLDSFLDQLIEES